MQEFLVNFPKTKKYLWILELIQNQFNINIEFNHHIEVTKHLRITN